MIRRLRCSKSRCKEGNGSNHTKDMFLKGRYLWNPNIPESYCKKNSDFINLLFDWLLCDAEEKGIAIPELHRLTLRN